MTTSEEILKWFDENKDWFKPTSISKKLKIDKGNFSRYLKSGIPEKYLIPIMEIIMPLGFTLDKIIAENNLPENKARILLERNTVDKKLDIRERPLTEGECNYPSDFNGLLKMAKEGVSNEGEFKAAVASSKLNGNQKSMVLSKLK